VIGGRDGVMERSHARGPRRLVPQKTR
jgi:hypothetical protein